MRGEYVNGSHIRFAQRGEHHDSKQPTLVVFTDQIEEQDVEGIGKSFSIQYSPGPMGYVWVMISLFIIFFLTNTIYQYGTTSTFFLHFNLFKFKLFYCAIIFYTADWSDPLYGNPPTS